MTAGRASRDAQRSYSSLQLAIVGTSYRRQMLATAVVCLTLASGLVVNGASPVGATSSREARDEAIRAIPWRLLTHQQRRAVRYVVRNPSIYRRLPTQVIDCDPELFTFLIQHPEVVADTWRSMGVSKVRIEPINERSFDAEDGLGTTGRFSFIESKWGDDAFNRALIYANGAFEGKPFHNPVNARCVLLLRSGSVVEANGRTYITVRLDSFLFIERMGVDLVAKTVRPLVSKAADHNFVETLKFVSNFSRAAERNPTGLERFTEQLKGLNETTRDELVKVCHATADRYAQAKQDQINVRLAEGSGSPK